MNNEITLMIIGALTQSMREHPVRWLLYSGIALLGMANVLAIPSFMTFIVTVGAALVIIGVAEVIAHDWD